MLVVLDRFMKWFIDVDVADFCADYPRLAVVKGTAGTAGLNAVAWEKRDWNTCPRSSWGCHRAYTAVRVTRTFASRGTFSQVQVWLLSLIIVESLEYLLSWVAVMLRCSDRRPLSFSPNWFEVFPLRHWFAPWDAARVRPNWGPPGLNDVCQGGAQACQPHSGAEVE